MFGDILKIVTREINNYIDLSSKLPSGTKMVVLNRPYKADGTLAIPDNSICLSLLNVEEELDNRSAIVNKRVIDGKVYRQNPDININLQIIFIANFKNDYTSELNYITKIIEFFQKKPFFSTDNTDGLSKLGIDKLSFKLNTIPLNEQHNIWGLLGGKYMPSIAYTISMIVIEDSEEISDISLVKEVHIDTFTKKNL